VSPSTSQREGYVRLSPGWLFSVTLGTTQTIWLGTDHLLCATNMLGISEERKHIRYRDIQALSAVRTQGWHWWTAFFLLAFLPPCILAAWPFSGTDFAIRILWASLAFPFGISLILNLLRGPTCRIKLTTAVQTIDLSSLSRWRRGLRALALLKSRIEEAQGRASPEDLAREMTMPVPGAEEAAASGAAPQEDRAGPGWHVAMFGLLLCGAAYHLVLVSRLSTILWIGGALLYMLVFAVALVALTRHRRAGFGRPLRVLTWTVLGFVGTLISVDGMLPTFYAIQAASRPGASPFGNSQLAVLQRAIPAMRESGGIWIFVWSVAGLSAAIGAAGLVMLGIASARRRA